MIKNAIIFVTYTDQGISNDPETLELNFANQGRTFLSNRYLDE